jgi:hypothetical protein
MAAIPEHSTSQIRHDHRVTPSGSMPAAFVWDETKLLGFGLEIIGQTGAVEKTAPLPRSIFGAGSRGIAVEAPQRI